METVPPVVAIMLARATRRIPGLKRLPLFELVIAAEVLMLAKGHYERLTPAERRRLVMIVRETQGRPSNLTTARRRELEDLIQKAEPRLFAVSAAEKLSPLSLRRRR